MIAESSQYIVSAESVVRTGDTSERRSRYAFSSRSEKSARKSSLTEVLTFRIAQIASLFDIMVM